MFTNRTTQSVLLLMLIALTMGACANKNAIKPGDTVDVAFDKAKLLYDKQKYGDAARAFETVLSLGRGTEQAREAQYLLADSYFKNREYIISASEYRRYVTFYPRSERREEAEFMEAYSYYKISPRFKLDQTDTERAITLFRVYIGKYPDSEKTSEAAELIDEMRNKLARKSFTSANMYFNLKLYNSAAMYFQVTIDNFPETEYAEQSLAKQVQAYTLYADISVAERQAERYRLAVDSWQRYTQLFPNGKNRGSAESFYNTARSALDRIGTPADVTEGL
jgi:outer membrane protein assembly factor BamD